MTDHANEAAAVAAGWAKLQTDRGATASPRYVTEFWKPLTGAPAGASGKAFCGGRGESNVSQAAADTVGFNSLQGFRTLRYGKDAAVSKDGGGNQHTVDLT